MKKIVFVLFMVLVTYLGYFQINSIYNNLSQKYHYSAKGHIVDYKFKNNGGYVYKRKFDFTANQWIGEWESV